MLHDHPSRTKLLLAERFNVIGWIYMSKNQSCSIARRTGYLLCRLERAHSSTVIDGDRDVSTRVLKPLESKVILLI